jgi:4Fe-4S ferredoxin
MPTTSEPRHAPGTFVPVIYRNRCEGKGPCVAACPYGVLSIGVLGKAERSGLSLVGRVKAIAHGHRQAFVTSPEACSACGDCVRVCPENAISLARAQSATTD